MIRPVLTEIGIFLVPFAIYAAYLLVNRARILEKDSWPLRIVVKLAIAAFLLVFLSLILLAQFSGAPPESTYAPAHMEDGKLVRGVNK